MINWSDVLAASHGSVYDDSRKERNKALRQAFPNVNFSANNVPRDHKQAQVDLKLAAGSILALERIAVALEQIVPHLEPRFMSGKPTRVMGIIHSKQYQKGAKDYELHQTGVYWLAVEIGISQGWNTTIKMPMVETPDVMIALQTLYKQIYKDTL